jgi:adenylate cyclase class 2
MENQGQELEVKYYLRDRQALENRLQAASAEQVQPRTHEVNLRFDTPDYNLLHTHQVLRLRKDQGYRVTYKGPGEADGGVRRRREIEFTVSDFETARQFFEALGYVIAMMYEKYRATYQFGKVLVTLDEMPFGDFAEIEGPDPESIQAAGQALGLDWERRILDSYTALFDLVKAGRGLAFRDLSFENFQDLEIEAHDLHVLPADTSIEG